MPPRYGYRPSWQSARTLTVVTSVMVQITSESAPRISVLADFVPMPPLLATIDFMVYGARADVAVDDAERYEQHASGEGMAPCPPWIMLILEACPPACCCVPRGLPWTSGLCKEQ